MERRVEFVGSIIIFFVLLFVYSKWGPAIPFSTTTQYRGEPMVVSADATIKVTPDVAKISFGVESQGQNLKIVQDEVNKKSQKLVSEIKEFGINEKDIKTSGYNIYPQNDYDTTPAKIVGYSVSINYIVTVRDFEKVNNLITLVTQNGANRISGVSFEISDTLREEKLNTARKEASDKAKEKARGLAQASGITLGKIINISENMSGDNIRPYSMKNTLPITGGGDVEISEPEITPGENELTVNISLSYEVR